VVAVGPNPDDAQTQVDLRRSEDLHAFALLVTNAMRSS
jgi:hypothetical protein